jgi:hypothetical protein
MVVNSVVDRRRFDADPDPTFHFDADPDPDPDPDSTTSYTHVENLNFLPILFAAGQFTLFLLFSSAS